MKEKNTIPVQSKELLRRQVYKISCLVAAKMEVKVNDLYAPGRQQPAATARQMVWRIAKDIHQSKLPDRQLAQFFNRGRVTILQGVRSVSNQIDTNRHIREQYRILLASARNTLRIPDPGPAAYDRRLVEVLRCSNIISARIALRKIMSESAN